MLSILVHENDRSWKRFFSDVLNNACRITFPRDGDDVRRCLKCSSYDVVILDLHPDGENGFDLLSWIVSEYPFMPVIAVSESARTEFVVKAMKLGAFDFVPKPLPEGKIKHAVDQALENRSLKNERDYLRRNQDVVYSFKKIVSASPAMKEIIGHLKRFSRTDATILMTGETGTGKSFLAGTLHFNSHRKEKPFVSINCANIPETLLESELFGHEKGSFTGADKLRIGRFEQARGGTVFLDEIGELSPALQAKLLKVLEEKCFERVGGTVTIHSDVRFITATNRNLEAYVATGLFRKDLYFRIKVLSVMLPPLRDRKKCMEPLCGFLLEKISREQKKRITGFSPKVMEWIKSYPWPGNIRELSNSIERAVILEDGEVIQEKNFPVVQGGIECPVECGLVVKMDEKMMIIRALEKSLWIQKDAAKMLGISPRNLNYKIKKYGIRHFRWRKHC